MNQPIPQSMNPKVLGVRFDDDPVELLVAHALEHGGLVVVPSGPGMAVDHLRNAEYRRALVEADLCIPDSGAMVVFMRLLRGVRMRRVSGLHFLWELFLRERIKMPRYTYWVHPDAEQAEINKDWLHDSGFEVHEQGHYVAPLYPKSGLQDPDLFASLQAHQPKVIILCLGGGVQERLGWWIREQYRAAGLRCPAILCTGAAIGFITGTQVQIPFWADALYLGWLFRCVYDPKLYVPRYVSALALAWWIGRYGEALPPLRGADAEAGRGGD